MPSFTTHDANPLARWIRAEQIPAPNTWMRFRTEFQIASKPNECILRVAVDSKYWLWVNGTLLVREGALKRGPTPTDTYADVVDVGPLLRAGRNVLAVRTWYWGVDSSSHLSSGHGALWVGGTIGSVAIGSGSHWRVSIDPAFLPSALRRFNHQTVLSEWNVHFDASRDDARWTEPDFDDTAWAFATAVGFSPSAPWGRLVDRPIPFWNDRPLADYESIDTNGQTMRSLLPANLQVYPYFEIDAPAGRIVTVQIERDWKTTTYFTRSGLQAFEVPAWGNGHFVDYTFPADVTVRRLAFRETGYAAGLDGRFACDDERLNTLWTKSARSTYVNLRDGIMDCPDRERAQWPGDAVNTLDQGYRALAPAFNPLAEKFFSEISGWRTPDGVLWGAVPSGRFRGTYREFPGQMLPTVGSTLLSYLMHTGENEGAARFLPHARAYLLRHFQVDRNKLVAHRGPSENNWAAGTQPWYDWGTHQDTRLLDNTLYLHALMCLQTVAGWVNDGSEANEVSERISMIRAGFFHLFCHEGQLRSPEYGGETDERGHALATLCNLVPDHFRNDVLRVLDRERHASIYFERFVLEAICRLGDMNLAVRRMTERYAREIASSYSTLPEQWGENSNHAWGGGPLFVLSRWFAGIEPTSPGYRTLRIRPSPGPLRQIRTVVPSVAGPISIELQRTPSRTTVAVSTPPETQGELHLSGNWWKPAETQPLTVRVDGHVYIDGLISNKDVTIPLMRTQHVITVD